MALTSQAELHNTRDKLRRLEQLHEEQSRAPTENAYARALSLGSIATMIKQLREVMIRFEVRASPVRADREPSALEVTARSNESQ